MYISDFKYHKPKTLNEASKILQHSDSGAVLGGGTDLLVEVKNNLRNISEIVSLSDIKELKTITEDSENIYIGAATTHNELIQSKILNDNLPALTEAASKIGSHQIRNVGTIGGNLCTAASCADTAPILIAYDASVELYSENGRRIVPLKNFFLFHHKTDIKKDEIMSKIIVPKIKDINGACFEKFGLREAGSISVASSAFVISFKSNVCTYACLVIGACAPVPVVVEKIKDIFIGKNFNDINLKAELLDLSSIAASEATIPIDDIRGSAEYRRELTKVLTRRAIQNAIIRTGLK